MGVEAQSWADRVRLAVEAGDGAPPGLGTPAGALWLFTIGAESDRHLGAHRLDAAQDTYASLLAALRAQPASDQQRKHLAVVYHQLGRIAEERGHLEEAESWYRKSLAIKERLNNQPGMARSYHQLGITAYLRGNLDDADTWYHKSLAINAQLNNQPGMALTYHALGMTAQERGNLDDADTWYHTSLTINAQLNNQPGIAMTYGQLGLLCEARGQVRQALEWMVRSVALFREFPHPSTGPAPAHLARLTRRLGLPVLEQTWHTVTGQPLPETVRAFVHTTNT
ncbi:hypothetical protein BJF83_20225 [Nocardiopsis sp. CNR-923]|uniref:tetratricopeptide repeat protein n=1 Tax=Nocardiopsis sp. CNR-923 TaxID=1904965 RepID=UPI000962F0D2|nr:tetratricopeptide repeat protein [Nocardiopsis sp. CNR-923]OLT26834.1 hypothetical protein BJF83_20225 [Nocardiopsis sp. CNR-923]